MATPIQRIHKEYKSTFEVARRYYKIIFELNNLHITPKELDLVAFSAINGTISTPPVREQFIKEFNIPIGSIYNMSAKLQKSGVLVKDKDDKIRVHPSILPDFTQGDLMLVIKLDNGSE